MNTNKFVSVHLQGGLGNQLFQLSFLDYFSKKTGRMPSLTTLYSPRTVHSSTNYFETIFKNWAKMFITGVGYYRISEEGTDLRNPSSIDNRFENVDVIFDGYFQDYRVMGNIEDKLIFNTDILSEYPDIQDKFFIHVRGGDYLEPTKELHNVDLSRYYQKCLEICKGEQFVVFTNDTAYAHKLLGSNFPIINESEVDTLYLMSKCKGCICANSSFSWWGAYLNPNRPIYMPSKWYNHDPNIFVNYYFKGTNVIEVNA